MAERVAGMREIGEFLESLRIGEAETQRNLTMFPIFSDTAKDDGYTFLDDAVGTKKFRVTEISDGGHVPELKVINGLDADVLILDGEELVGAKQSRIVNTTLIIGRMREVVIPVSCVDRGRWHYRTKAFTSGKANLYAELRRKKAKAVR